MILLTVELHTAQDIRQVQGEGARAHPLFQNFRPSVNVEGAGGPGVDLIYASLGRKAMQDLPRVLLPVACPTSEKRLAETMFSPNVGCLRVAAVLL
jgi:hypothetical protein